ncbi:hypothetical protein [Actinomadura alba]|uniref:Mce-associated membrane protein n=1 Tax=Actinomadura alba TaxID=406431 RepID=A0ABR7LMT2_9ACTN|nr:hypothetical protein [Actinomadura alba]MBC6466035.1 hypothetical protein [Actinomadura alba]
MTSKTTKGQAAAEDIEEPGDVATEGSGDEAAKGAPASSPTPKKRVRRVRVIEVIDDEDVDEDLGDVLNALDDADRANRTDRADRADDDDEADEAEPPAGRSLSRSDAADDDEAPGERAERRAQRTHRDRDADRLAGPRAVLASPRLTTGLVVVLVAALAALAVWQWRAAATRAEAEAERRDVAKVAGEYGNVVFSYTPGTAQASIDRNLKLIGGDLLANYRQTTAANLPAFFTKNPEVSMTSKIKGVFVGDVNGKLATAVILLDVRLQTPQGANDAPNTLLRLSLSKEDDGWKVTEQKASGDAEGAASGGAGQLPGLTGNGASPSPGTGEDSREKKD